MDFGRDKENIKNSMSIDEVFSFLTSLGLVVHWVDSGELSLETCCHNPKGEGKIKMFYYDNTKLFYCYTGCGMFDIFELISKISVVEDNTEISLDDAISIYSNSQGFVKFSSKESIEEIDKNLPYIAPSLRAQNKNILLNFPRVVVKDWLEEGISIKTQEKYNIRLNLSGDGASILIPHLGDNLDLVSVKQRNLALEEIERNGKYRPLIYRGEKISSPSSFYLFGLAYNKKNIQLNKKAIVFEGEKSVMLLDDVLGPNNNISVATFGMNFSRHQYEKLKSLGIEEIVIAFDRQFQEVGDKEYQNLMRVIQNIVDRYSILDDNISFSFILDRDKKTDYKDSPVDKGLDIFSELYHSREKIEANIQK